MERETIRHMSRAIAEAIQSELAKDPTNWDLIEALTNTQNSLVNLMKQMPEEQPQQKISDVYKEFPMWNDCCDG